MDQELGQVLVQRSNVDLKDKWRNISGKSVEDRGAGKGKGKSKARTAAPAGVPAGATVISVPAEPLSLDSAVVAAVIALTSKRCTEVEILAWLEQEQLSDRVPREGLGGALAGLVAGEKLKQVGTDYRLSGLVGPQPPPVTEASVGRWVHEQYGDSAGVAQIQQTLLGILEAGRAGPAAPEHLAAFGADQAERVVSLPAGMQILMSAAEAAQIAARAVAEAEAAAMAAARLEAARLANLAANQAAKPSRAPGPSFS